MSELLVVLPGIIIGLFFVISVDFIIALRHARDFRRGGHYSYSWVKHQTLMKGNVYKVIIGVVLIEIFIRIVGVGNMSGLFMIHLGFAAPFLVSLLVLAFWQTGLRSPNFHRKLGYICLGAFVGVLATGVPLLTTLLRR